MRWCVCTVCDTCMQNTVTQKVHGRVTSYLDYRSVLIFNSLLSTNLLLSAKEEKKKKSMNLLQHLEIASSGDQELCQKCTFENS